MKNQEFTPKEFLDFLKKSGKINPAFFIEQKRKYSSVTQTLKTVCQLNQNNQNLTGFQEKLQIVKQKNLMS